MIGYKVVDTELKIYAGDRLIQKITFNSEEDLYFFLKDLTLNRLSEYID